MNTTTTTPEKREQHFAYRRVSTIDQNTQRQLDGLGIKFDKEYEDHASGGSTNRPQLKQMLQDLELMAKARKAGLMVEDAKLIVHVHSIDRMARSITDLKSLVDELNAKGATVVFHKENLTFGSSPTPQDKMMLGLLGVIAEFERDMIRQRQAEGIAIAKKDPKKYPGRAHALKPHQVEELKRKAAEGVGKTDLAKEFGISRSAVYVYLSGK